MDADLLPAVPALAGLLLLSGWVAVDGTSAGQFMVSRPLVAACLAGLLVGNPVAGAQLGLILEAFHLAVLPVGAARYPEGGPPAVVSAAVYAAAAPSPAALLVAVLFALGWEWISGATVRGLRHTNVRLLSLRPGAPAETLQGRHLASIALDFVRGVLLGATGLGLLGLLMQASLLRWGAGDTVPRVVLGAVLAGLLAGSARIFGGRVRLFVAGAVGGLLFVWLRS